MKYSVLERYPIKDLAGLYFVPFSLILSFVFGLVISMVVTIDMTIVRYASFLVSVVWLTLISTGVVGFLFIFNIGLMFGFGLNIGTLGWIFQYIHSEYNGEFIAFGTYFFILVVLSLRFALVSIFIKLVSPLLDGFSPLKVLLFILSSSSVYVLSGYIYSLGESAFPWFHPGAFLVDYIPTVFSVSGGLGVDFLLCFNVIGLAVLLYYGRFRTAAIYVAITVLAVSFFYFHSKNNTETTITSGNTVRLRVLHGANDVMTKQSSSSASAKVRKYLALSGFAPSPDLVIWPESSVPLASVLSRQTFISAMSSLVEKGTDVIYGAQFQKGLELVNVANQGTRGLKPVYTKQRLVPFGEFRPTFYKKLINMPLSRGEDISPVRKSQKPTSLSGQVELAISICFEALFSNTYREQLRHERPTLLLLLSDLQWSSAPWIKRYLLLIAQTRAAELGLFLAYSTNGGISAVIDPEGRILASVSGNKTEFIDAEVSALASSTTFSKYGDTPVIALSLLSIFCAGIWVASQWRRQRRQIHYKEI
ncbi:apolipoprotein N-acyltransferase [Grimontia marina]|uniref:Apolipoprotein N-acyltransferase n=1 Tax=Grimontia marina TaxID=646534 RepID=A0A128FK15_9GAMM|nr:apolipoprotein N-acyltransferase [Grimontia marina]CZF86815.1 Apolipoprotein N-acyltransferase [Grimontia marina]